MAAIRALNDSSKLTLMELMETLIACEKRMQKLDNPPKQAYQSKLNTFNNDEDNKNSHI